MKVKETILKGCFIIEPRVYEDNRGLFYESYSKKNFEETIRQKIDFVQDNHSVSKQGVLRGLHFQKGNNAQAKWVCVTKGEVLDVVVDLRKDSATFGEYFKIKLSGQNRKTIFIPKGMAHGFLALSNDTTFVYKCDEYYKKEAESGIIYNDTDLAIDWEYPLEKLILSQKDEQLPSFKSLDL